MRFVTPALLVFPLAVFGACAAATAHAGDKRAADVTITVVEDPDQLKDKVNTISLPDADEDSRAEQKPGNQNESGKNSHGADDKQRSDAADGAHDVDEKAQSAAEAAKSDTNDARQQNADAHDDDAHH